MITLALRSAEPVELVGSFASVVIPAIPNATPAERENRKILRLRARRDMGLLPRGTWESNSLGIISMA